MNQREVDAHCATKPPPVSHRLLWGADRITNYSMLTLIYRSLPPPDPSKSSFRVECVDTARKALEEHKKCLALLSPVPRQAEFLGLFVDWFVTLQRAVHCSWSLT